jgi:Skp family chaperone for outer membrane proteins
MLGPLGLGITALTFTIDYVIRERRETDLSRIESNVRDLRNRFGEAAQEANVLMRAVSIVEQNLNNGIGTTEDASRTLNQLGQSFGIVNLQTRNMTRSQMEMHIRALNDAFQQQYRQTQNNVNGNTDLESTLLRLDASQKKLKNSTKGSKEEAKEFWSEWQRVTGNLTPVENSIKNVTDQALILKKTLNRPYESPFAKFAAGAKLA